MRLRLFLKSALTALDAADETRSHVVVVSLLPFLNMISSQISFSSVLGGAAFWAAVAPLGAQTAVWAEVSTDTVVPDEFIVSETPILDVRRAFAEGRVNDAAQRAGAKGAAVGLIREAGADAKAAPPRRTIPVRQPEPKREPEPVGVP